MVRRLIALTPCALALMGAGKPRTPDVILEDARLACRAYNGDDQGIVAAYAELEALVAADPKNARAWYRMGDILMLRACPGLHVDRALAEDPNLPEAHNGRAWILKLRRDDWGAEEEVRLALGLRPGFISALHLKGVLAQDQGQTDTVIAAGNEIVEKAKAANDVALGHALLADAWRARGDFDRADASHRAIVALQPKSAWAKGNYASFLMHVRRVDDAIIQAKAALALMDYGAARATLRHAYRAKAYLLREKEDERGAQKYDRLAEQIR